MKARLVKATIIFAVSSVIVGCGTGNDRYYVQREWSKSLRELGIVPFFPPREDVFVGDVYAFGYNPQSLEVEKAFLLPWEKLSDEQQACRRTIGMSPRLARLGTFLSDVVSDEYKETISAPRTTPDYDNIVGNPAWEAANRKVQAAQAKLGKLEQAVKDADAAIASLTQEKQQLQWAVDDAQTALNEAQTALSTAKSVPIDVSAEEAAVERADAAVLAKEDARLAAQRAQEDVPQDAPQADKDAAANALKQATRDLEDAKTAKSRADSALTKKKAEIRNVTAEEQAVADARDAKLTAERNLLQKSRDLETATSAAQKLATDSESKIAVAKASVQSAIAVRDAIAKAGAGLLHAQPREDKYNIFLNDSKAAKLSTGLTPDDTFGSRTNRLRLVGFPEFATASFSQGDLSALVPIEAMGLGINISRSSIDRVNVKVPAAESYALSAAKVMDKLFQHPTYSNDGKPIWRANSESPLTGSLPFVDAVANREACASEGGNSNLVYLQIVTEVFYARALDVSLFSSDTFGMRAQLASPTTTIGAQALPTDDSGLPEMSAASLDIEGLDSATAKALLTKLQSRLGTTQTVPGGSIQIVNYSDRSIGLRRVFDRPIAIGMRGITVEYNPATQSFDSIGPASEVTPKFNRPNEGSELNVTTDN
jgi:hypothetical protein